MHLNKVSSGSLADLSNPGTKASSSVKIVPCLPVLRVMYDLNQSW